MIGDEDAILVANDLLIVTREGSVITDVFGNYGCIYCFYLCHNGGSKDKSNKKNYETYKKNFAGSDSKKMDEIQDGYDSEK